MTSEDAMRRLLIAAVLALLPFSAHAGKMIIGYGNSSCGAWTQAHSSQGSSFGFDTWLMGYLSGVSVWTDGADWLVGTDFIGNVAWVTNYCRANPLDTIGTAAQKLVMSLQERKK
jgi:hypothetical protein